MRNWLLTFILLTVVSCSSAGSATSPAVMPDSTNSPASPTDVPMRTATLSPSQPGTGWETFKSTNLQIAIDYPPDWSVGEQAISVSFRSTSGVVIQLTKIETGNLSPEEFLSQDQLPNTRCSSSTNSHGITVLVCLDTLSGTYSADFVMRSLQGSPQLLSLTMPKRGDLQVFKWMVGSVRPPQGP